MTKTIPALILFLFISFSYNSVSAQPYGLEERVANTSLLISSSGDVQTQLKVERVFADLDMRRPIFMTHASDGSDRLFVVLKEGLILVFPNKADVSEGEASEFLDISGKVDDGPSEAGLLGLAFHPDFKENGKFYVHYNIDADPLISVISEFLVSNNPDSADPESERVLLTTPQPYSNHNGGMIAFGQDDYLYIALGDGGSGGDPDCNGQDRTTLLGSILRIDVNNKDANLEYAIPQDNPYADNPNDWREEIYAYGLRNPWRFSFDRVSGMLWAADVGQSKWEEVNIIESGKNYGWNHREGFHYYSDDCQDTGEPLIDPIVEYDHDEGQSITGGYVYRGDDLTDFYGIYFYGDYVSRSVWALDYRDGEVKSNEKVLTSPNSIASFAEDEEGELYIVSLSGEIYKFIQEAIGDTTSSVPQTISESGLYADMQTRELSPGLIPYSINSPFWSDGADKERVLALPGTTQIAFSEDGHWEFPQEAVLVKNFYLELERGNPESKKLIETRFLVKQSEGELWDGYSYLWNEEGTDATLLETSLTKDYTIIDSSAEGGSYTHSHYYPSRNECSKCHTPAAGYVLGVRTAQINKQHVYENGVSDNQLRSYNHIELFTIDIGEDYSEFPQWPNPFDPEEPLEKRARSYLASNCAYCHQPEGTGRSNMDLRYATMLEATNTVNETPELGDLGVEGADRIKPGHPDSSVVYLRMINLAEYRMPPLASNRVDTAGASVISEWITSLLPTRVIARPSAVLPDMVELTASPNPFNPTTKISYTVPALARVKLEIFDILGHRLSQLVDRQQNPGRYTIGWDAVDAHGSDVTAGVYFYRLYMQFDDRSRAPVTQIKKLIYIK